MNGTKRITQSPKLIEYHHNYIFTIKNLKEFELLLENLKLDGNWNPHGRFLIIITSIIDNTFKWSLEIILSLSKVFVTNIVILAGNYLDNTQFLVYSWYPFNNGSCGDNYVNDTKLIDNCQYGEFRNNVELFDSKLVKEFNRCEIKVRTVPWAPYVIDIRNNSIYSRNTTRRNRGYDVNILNIAAQVYNLRMHYIMSRERLNWGHINMTDPIQFVGNLHYLYTHENDVVIGGYRNNLGSFLYLDDTRSYVQESLHFCVPNHPVSRGFDILTKIITPEAWCLLLTTYLTISILLWLFTKNTRERTTLKGILNCLENCYRILIGVPITLQPITIKARILISMMILCSFYLLSAYQTLLLSILSDDRVVQNIETIDDIYSNRLKMYFLAKEDVDLVATTLGRPYDQLLLNNWLHCENVVHCLHYVAFDRDSAICLHKSFIDYVSNSYVNDYDEPLLYCFKQPVVIYPVSILMAKGFPFFKLIDDIIVRLNTYGFFEKWRHEIKFKKFVTTFRANATELEYGGSIIDLMDLQPIFIAFLMGNGIATIVFALESLVFRYNLEMQELVREKNRIFKQTRKYQRKPKVYLK